MPGAFKGQPAPPYPSESKEPTVSTLGNILSKIFHPTAAKPTSSAAQPTAPAPAPAPAPIPNQPAATTSPSPSSVDANASRTESTIDVGLVLAAMAEMKEDRGGNYKSSIVDLLKLLDLDSSLTARKELAQELGVRAGEDGSAEQNIALHRAVMEKLVANGGIVPDELRS